MTFPNTIIAGVPKGGTTSVFQYLSDHPEVCSSSVKETKYLIDKEYPLFSEKTNYFKQGLEGYQSFFNKCNVNEKKIILEATPDYIYQKTPLEVLPNLNPMPNIIFVLRNPAKRLYSFFNFAKNNMGVLKKNISFTEYINRLSDSNDPILRGRVLLNNGLEHGKYINYLKKWIYIFGNEKVYVCLFEELINDNKAFMKRMAQNLNINPVFYDTYNFENYNYTYQVKNYTLNYLWKKVQNKIKINLVRRLVNKYYLKLNTKTGKNEITDEDRSTLLNIYNQFKPFNEEFSRYFGIDITLWRNEIKR